MCGNKIKSIKVTRKLIIAAIMLIAAMIVSCENKVDFANTEIGINRIQEDIQAVSGDMQVHFIDVGQGDAALITCGEHAMLFDAGGNDKGTLLQFYLMKQGIRQLDYVIGSHPEADHIGGMDVILLKYNCDKVMLPDVKMDTATYQDVLNVMQCKNYKITIPKVGETYQLGEAFFTIIAPNREDYGDNMNNYSIGIKLVHGENVFIFTGDAETQAEEDMLKNGIPLDANVLKVGHHGSCDASSREFMKAVSPEYAVISCGKGNEYGHPHKETLDILEDMGAEIFRTDEQGSIIALSDGKTIVWSLTPQVSWQEPYYVGNKNNRKLHRSTCNSLPKEWNQVIFESKEEAVGAGFTGFCSGCKP